LFFFGRYKLKEKIYEKLTKECETKIAQAVCFKPKKVLLLGSGGLSIG
jgi:hypothetical protein